MMAYSSVGGAVMMATDDIKRETAAQARARGAEVSLDMKRRAMNYDRLIVDVEPHSAVIERKSAAL